MDREDNPGVLTPRNRVISESTGLFKLQLSPQRKLPQVFPTRSSKGLRVNVPIVEQTKEPQAPTKNDLLAKYASKQAKLMELEKHAEVLRFELLELQAQLHQEINRDFTDTIKDRANLEVNNLKKKVSSIFQNNAVSPMAKKPSTIFSERPPQESLTKKPSTVFSNQETLKKKASTMFNNKFLAEVRGRMDQQQAEIDKFAKKGSDLAKTFFTSFSPKKNDLLSSHAADSSFVFESMGESSIPDKSILLSEDDTVEHSAIDIDDYSSSEE